MICINSCSKTPTGLGQKLFLKNSGMITSRDHGIFGETSGLGVETLLVYFCPTAASEYKRCARSTIFTRSRLCCNGAQVVTERHAAKGVEPGWIESLKVE
jgi:hypothetical protein